MSLAASLWFALAITEPAVAAVSVTAASTSITTSAFPPSPVTAPAAPMTTPDEQTWPRWEMTVGFQGWDDAGYLALGYRKQIHEIRLLSNVSYPVGPAVVLDYRATFLRRGRFRMHGGGLFRYPFRAGGQIGAAYRSGGEWLLGRTEWGVNAGAWCGTDRVNSDCGPMLGFYGGFYFDDGYFGGFY